MAQKINRLTALGVLKIRKPGYHSDGGGLWLQVSEAGGKSWIFTYSIRGRAREMGLGSLSRGVNLAEARAERDKCNRLLREHVDPIEARKQQRAAAILKEHGTITFAEATSKYLAAHRAEWTPKHAKQWTQTLHQYVAPELGKLLVSDIGTAHVVRTLEKIWPSVNAERLRGRIETILDFATVQGFRQGDNPAQWRGRLDKLLAAPRKSRRVEHLAALSYAEVPALMERLRREQGAAARALEFTILTAARTGEVRGATPQEIDGGVWTVPADRMKARREHRVPLSRRALELAGNGGAYLFPGQPGKSIHVMAMLNVLRRMGCLATVHGFRSAFRDWAAERTNFPAPVAEMALAHATGSAVERAYRRSDLFDLRRRLMEQWAEFCATPPAKSADRVVSLRSAQ
jgi:integrase